MVLGGNMHAGENSSIIFDTHPSSPNFANVLIGDHLTGFKCDGSSQTGNVYIGGGAGRVALGQNNIALGPQAGDDIDGDHNIVMGYRSGPDSSGNGNICIGKRGWK